MKKIMAVVVAFFAGALVFLPSVSSAAPDAKPVSSRQDDTPCLPARDVRSYTLCAALWEQPSYDVRLPDGTIIGTPTGSELIAELSEEGLTPNRNAATFRRAARALIGDYFDSAKR